MSLVASQSAIAAGAGSDPKPLAELKSQRTETSRTFVMKDGQRMTQVSSAPVNFRDATGSFQPIDTTLHADASGDLSPAGTSGDLTLPKTAGDPAVVEDEAGRSVSFRLLGADDRPVSASKSTATYADVRPGVDATYQALANGVKETLVVSERSAPSTYRYVLDLSDGLTAALDERGAVVVRDAARRVRFVLPAPTVQAADAKVPTGSHVSYALSGDGRMLSVVVDPEWLSSAALPVKIDPTVYSDAAAYCTISSGSLEDASTCNDDAAVRIGFDGSHKQRVAARFDLGSIIPTSAAVIRGRLAMYYNSQSPTATVDLDVKKLKYRVDVGATWNTFDGISPWDTPGGDITEEHASSFQQLPSYANGYIGVGISAMVEDWVRDPANNSGMLIKARDETVNEVMNVNHPFVQVWWKPKSGSPRDATTQTIPVSDRSSIQMDMATGNAAINNTDIRLPGKAGMDLTIGRTYNLQGTDGHQRWFGINWFDSVNGAGTQAERNWQDEGRVIWLSGMPYRFERDPSKDVAGTWAYTSPPGIDATLTVSTTTWKQTVTFRDGTQWLYGDNDANDEMPLSQIKDSHGNTITINYSQPDFDQKISTIVDSYGRTLTFNYDTSSRLKNITDATGRHWDYNQTATTDWGFSGYRLNSYTDPDGKTVTYEYSGSKLVSLTDGRSTKIVFDYITGNAPVMQPATATRFTRVIDGTTANDVVWDFDFQPGASYGHSCSDTGAVRSVAADPRGKLTTFCSNPKGQVTETWDALNRKAIGTYTSSSNVATIGSAAGGTGQPLTLNYSSDGYDNFTDGKAPAGETFAAGYCAGGTCSPSDQNSYYRPTSSTNPQGVKTNFAWSANTGDLSSVSDGNSPTVAQQAFTYNANGTIATSSARAPSSTATTPVNLTTNYAYFASGELQKITPPSASTLIGTTQLTYQTNLSRIASITDGRGTTQTITYDGNDRPTKITWAAGKTFEYTYDANGNVTQRVERNTPAGAAVNTSTYVYDKLNRRTSETLAGKTTSYTYDKTGNLSSITDPTGTSTYTYDDINRVASVTSPKTVTAVNCSTTPASCDTVTYAYTDMPPAASPYNGGSTYKQTATYPGGLKQEQVMNGSGQMVTTAVRNSANTVLRGYSYAYKTSSANPQRSVVQSQTLQPGTEKTTYQYGTGTAGSSTDVQRLKSAIVTNSANTVLRSWSYDYDGAGNRTRRTNVSGTTTTYDNAAYNDANELCWARLGNSANVTSPACGTVPSGATSYAYDAAGNQTTGFAYDVLNRVTQVGTTAISALSPTNDELAGYGTTQFQNNLLGVGRIIPASGSATAYVRQAAGSPVAQRVGTTKQHLFTDRLGSVIAVADDNANALTRTVTYDPDGNPTAVNTGTGTGTPAELGYAGGHTLPGGQIHFGARYYQPNLGRWNATDPLVQAGDYSYAASDPINALDRNGLSPTDSGAYYGKLAACLYSENGRACVNQNKLTDVLDTVCDPRAAAVAGGISSATAAKYIAKFSRLRLFASYYGGACGSYEALKKLAE